MATKAERFKAKMERSRSKPPKEPKARKAKKKTDDDVDTSAPGVSASDKKVGAKSTAVRNQSKRAAGKARAKLEDSESGTPSRKSTRKSATRSRSASNLARRTTGKTTSPSARARRSNAGRQTRP